MCSNRYRAGRGGGHHLSEQRSRSDDGFSPDRALGVVRVLAADTVEHHGGDHARTAHAFEGPSVDVVRQELLVGAASYDLSGPRLPANAMVRVTALSAAATSTSPGHRCCRPRRASSSRRPGWSSNVVLVMLADWTAPDSVTPGFAYHQVFGDTQLVGTRTRPYGQLTQRGDVTPWMQIPGPADGRCYGDRTSTMTQAKSAAAALGYDVASYDNFILYFPNATRSPARTAAPTRDGPTSARRTSGSTASSTDG